MRENPPKKDLERQFKKFQNIIRNLGHGQLARIQLVSFNHQTAPAIGVPDPLKVEMEKTLIRH